MRPVYVNSMGEPVSETEALRDGVLQSGYDMLTPLAMKDGSSRGTPISDAQAEADAYSRSVSDMNAWRGGPAEAHGAPGGKLAPLRDSQRATDADLARLQAEADAAYDRSVAALNGGRE
jgi:hypothetical protein